MNPDSLLVALTVLDTYSANFALCIDDVSEHTISSYEYSEKHVIEWNQLDLNQEITLFVNDKLLYNISGHLVVSLNIVSSIGPNVRIFDRMPATDVEVACYNVKDFDT